LYYQTPDKIPINLREVQETSNEFVQRQIFSKKVVRFINLQPKTKPSVRPF